MEENKTVKLGIFKKMIYSITKFEKYPLMASEGVKQAIKYLVCLAIIITIVMSGGIILELNKSVKKLSKYIEEKIPEFQYSNGILSMNDNEKIISVNDPEIPIGPDMIIINTLADNEEKKLETEKQYQSDGISIFLFKDEILLKTKIEGNNELRQNFTYQEFIYNNTGKNVESFDKNQFIGFLNGKDMNSFYFQYFFTISIGLFIANLLKLMLEIFEISLFGLITTFFAGMKLKFPALYSMSAYSITLSVLLKVIYFVVNYFVVFNITYFQIAYITIGYICLAAAIFMLKDDVIKKMIQIRDKETEIRLNIDNDIITDDKKENEKQKEEKKQENEEEKKDVEPKENSEGQEA